MIDVIINHRRIDSRVSGAKNKALAIVSEQILKDSNYYCRATERHNLIGSSLRASRPEQGLLVWQTPYARRVYYTGTPSKDVNPRASLQWCEKAKAAHLEDWQRVAQAAFDKGWT